MMLFQAKLLERRRLYRNHYEAIGRGDFDEAYSYLGPTFRSSNS